MKTVLELLVAGRDLISDPERWTVGKLARNDMGDARDPLDPGACRFCAMGALLNIVGWDKDSKRHEAMDLLNDAAGRHISFANDGPDGHAVVLRAYDIAIERARAKEAGG